MFCLETFILDYWEKHANWKSTIIWRNNWHYKIWRSRRTRLMFHCVPQLNSKNIVQIQNYGSILDLLHLETSNCQNSSHFSDLIAHLSITQLFALENVTQYLFGTKSFYVSIRFPLSVLCMDIRSYPYSNPFGFFRFSHR